MPILDNEAAILVAWYNPAPIFVARVNLASPTYPIQDIPFDSPTVGAYTDAHADMLFTLGSAEGLDDRGRGRLRAAATATLLKVNRSSQGTDDGSLDVVDDAWISVYPDFRVWSKVATIQNHIEYKDTDLAVGDLTEFPVPICNMGSDCARRIDPTTGKLRLFFPGSNSIPVADGATITNWAWAIDSGSAFALGTSAADADVFIDFDPGWHIVGLTVTDSNGKQNSGHRLVLAHDADNPLTIQTIKRLSITRTRQGSSAQIELTRPLPRSAYPDGGRLLVFQDRDALPIAASRDDQLFTGWHQVDQASSRATETHLRRETTLTLVDVLGRMDSLPGWPQRIEVPDAVAGLTWGEMPAANMDKFLHYLLHWHSTAGGVADFYPSGTWAEYPFVIFDSGGATLYEQLQRQAERIVPDHNFTCDRFGAMRIVPDPILQPAADRTTVTGSLTAAGISAIEFGYTRPPRVNTLRGSALLTQTAWLLDGDGEKQLLTPVFAIAPGTAPGQGGREQTIGERLAKSQAALNDCVGQRFARMNARYGDVTATFNLNSNPWAFDPADHTWIEVIIDDEYMPQRGSDFFNARCLPKEVSVDYTPTETGVAWRARMTLERETIGLPALTETHPPALPVDYTPPPPAPFVPPDPNDPDQNFGDITGYVLWDGATVARTWDLQAASPVWEEIGTGISGLVYDCQYMMVDAQTVGAWLMTESGIYFCGDVMATTPTWVETLTIAAVRAVAAAPTTGAVQFGSMTHYWSQPGHLCVALTLSEDDDDYLHAYYWVTEDYGQSWSDVDVTAYTFGAPPAERGYYYAGRYSLASFRSAPGTLWCGRGNGRTGISDGDGAVFRSDDLGYTWTKGYAFTGGRVGALPALLNPYPDASDASYLAVTVGGTNPVPLFLRSNDGWATAGQLSEPAGHGGAFLNGGHAQRPNKRPFDDGHVLALFQIDGSSNADLYESYDLGASWTLLRSLNNSVITPNGWPPDPLQWVLIDNTDSPHVQLTLDNFATLLDKSGNLAAIIAWTNGNLAGGFALPKVGANRGLAPLAGWGEAATATGGGYGYLGEAVQKTGGSSSSNNGSQSHWLMTHPPQAIKRIRIEGVYSCSYTKGASLTDGFARLEIETGTGLTLSSSLAGNLAVAPVDGSVGGPYWAEWARAVPAEWPLSKEAASAAPPSGHVLNTPLIEARCYSPNAEVATSVTFTAKVVEMETEAGTIYEY